jgi:hypothetical protein
MFYISQKDILTKLLVLLMMGNCKAEEKGNF